MAAILTANSFWALVGKEGGDAVAEFWIGKLTGKLAAIMTGDSFWASMGKEGGNADGLVLSS